MIIKILILFSVWNLASTVELHCSDQTLVYQYSASSRVYGSFNQKIDVEATVEVDCMGDSLLVNTEPKKAFDIVVRLTKVDWTVTEPDSTDMMSLCLSKNNETCNNNQDSPSYVDRVKTISYGKWSKIPFIVVQSLDGDVVALYFSNLDMKSTETINFKRDIALALQTRLNTNGDVNDDDIFGHHKIHIQSIPIANGQEKVVKSFKITENPEDTLRGQSLDVVDVTTVSNGHVVGSTGRVVAGLSPSEQDDEDAVPYNATSDVEVNLLEMAKADVNYTLTLLSDKYRLPQAKRLYEQTFVRTFVKTSMKKTEDDSDEEVLMKLLKNAYAAQKVSVQQAINLFDSDPSHLENVEKIISLETDCRENILKQKFNRKALVQNELIKAAHQIFINCNLNQTLCVRLSQAISFGHGQLVESILNYLLGHMMMKNASDWSQMVTISMQLSKPTDNFVINILHLLHQFEKDSEKFASLLLAVSSMAQQSSVSTRMKNLISAVVHRQLSRATNNGQCLENEITTDALEAAGNLGDVVHVERIAQIAIICRRSRLVRLSVLHSVRRMLHDLHVQDMLADTLGDFDCEILTDLLRILSSDMLDNKNSWPAKEVNEFDEKLVLMILNNDKYRSCLKDGALNYFKRKSGERALQLFTKLKSDFSRNKRRVYFNCRRWSGQHKISSSHVFSSDRRLYRKRKACLAHIRLGPGACHLNIYGGFFAGYQVPVSHCRAKIFTKLYADMRLIVVTIKGGVAYGYWVQQDCTRGHGRVYAEAAGKVFINQVYRTPNLRKVISYKKTYRKKFFSYRIVILSLNFYASFSATFKLDMHVNQCAPFKICATITPSTTLSLGGSGDASALIGRVGLEVRVNFNYYVGGRLEVSWRRSLCMRVYHGSSSNTISLRAYYEFRKVCFCGRWGWPRISWGGRKYISWLSKSWNLGGKRKNYLYNSC